MNSIIFYKVLLASFSLQIELTESNNVSLHFSGNIFGRKKRAATTTTTTTTTAAPGLSRFRVSSRSRRRKSKSKSSQTVTTTTTTAAPSTTPAPIIKTKADQIVSQLEQSIADRFTQPSKETPKVFLYIMSCLLHLNPNLASHQVDKNR